MTEKILSMIIPFALTVAVLPFYIKRLQILKWGQEIRPEGPQDHLSKKGTPTMGGLVIVAALFASAIWVRPMTRDYLVFLGVVLINAMAGFFDDFIKIKKTRSLGLRARDKLFIHILLGIALAWYMIKCTHLGGAIRIPFLGTFETGILIYPLCIAVMTGCVNAVNLTDGLDGLAAGSVIATLLGFAYICLKMERYDLVLGCVALIGALLGFLVFNCFPARIFMGDTGSLALGGALAALSILTGTEIFLVIMGGVYVVEALSVIIQVTYFKATKGKRIFKMSPIHHHFGLMGWHEVQVTTRFWIAGVFLTAIGIWLYRW
jgi:phospho-N-acetylmuramoyl-pentapeptide-transferase